MLLGTTMSSKETLSQREQRGAPFLILYKLIRDLSLPPAELVIGPCFVFFSAVFLQRNIL